MTSGSVEPLKKLHDRWGERAQFIDVLVRQAHPGPGVRPYRDLDQKMLDANRHKQEGKIPWPVLVDDLAGTVHQVYGGLADPTYLIDVDGRVAYYQMWTHAPNLHEAIDALVGQGGRGVVNGQIDHLMHMLPAMTDGWKGIARGLPQSYLDLELAFPGSGAGLWLGHQIRPLLAPVTLRAKPLPMAVQAFLGLGAIGAVVMATAAGRRLREGARHQA